MEENVNTRLTRLEVDSEHIKNTVDEIKRDLKPIKTHVIYLNALFKISTSALVVAILKRILE